VILKVFYSPEVRESQKKKEEVEIAIFLYLDFSILVKKKWKDD